MTAIADAGRAGAPLRPERRPAAVLLAAPGHLGLLCRAWPTAPPTPWCWARWCVRAATRSASRTGSRWRPTWRRKARGGAGDAGAGRPASPTCARCAACASSDDFTVEAGDASALAVLARLQGAGGARLPFVLGPHVNVYNRPALQELAPLGASRWVRAAGTGAGRHGLRQPAARAGGRPGRAGGDGAVRLRPSAPGLLGALFHRTPPSAEEGRLRIPLPRRRRRPAAGHHRRPALPGAQRHPDAIGRAALPDRRGARPWPLPACRVCACRPAAAASCVRWACSTPCSTPAHRWPTRAPNWPRSACRAQLVNGYAHRQPGLQAVPA